MFRHHLLGIVALLAAAACQPASSTAVSPDEVGQDIGTPRPAVADYNLDSGLALQGFDPVSYYPQGGGVPQRGTAEHSVRYAGVVYRFATTDNRAAFEADPAAFEPSYGGWCAWAMARGASKVNPDPENFLIEGGRLRVFYRNPLSDTRAKWERGDVRQLGADADENWTDVSGEVP